MRDSKVVVPFCNPSSNGWVPVVSFPSLNFGGWCCGIHHPKVWEVLIFICIFRITHGHLLVTRQHSPQWLSRKRADLRVAGSVPLSFYRTVQRSWCFVKRKSMALFVFCMRVYWQLAHTECPEQEKWREGPGGCLWQIHVLSCVTHGHVIKLWEYKTQCQKPPSKWLRLFCSLSSDAQRRHFLRKDLDSLGASYTPCLPENHVLLQEGTESKVRCARWSINWPDDILGGLYTGLIMCSVVHRLAWRYAQWSINWPHHVFGGL